MSELSVKIVELEPMRVVSAYGFGKEPEGIAWDKLIAWAQPRGLVEDPDHFRIFGFNNPNPSSGSPNYGYEFWLEAGGNVEPDGEMRVQDFGGGLYAVARCQGVENIAPTWQALVEWQTTSSYTHGGHHQWLEQHLSPVGTPPDELTLDLFMPIVK
jgi:DNA gyrase inhibitor GyrI